MSSYERTFHRCPDAFETVTGKQDLFRRQDQPIRSGAAIMAGSHLQQQGRVQTGRPPDHASLAMQLAPEATPPANHTWRSYYHAAGRRVALRVQDGVTGTNHVHYLFADHLGSSSVSYRGDGGQTVPQR